MPTSFFAPVSSTISADQELSNTVTMSWNMSPAPTFTLCDRTDGIDKQGNYFMSFNLPFAASQMLSGATLSMSHPELFQLNVDQIIITPIPQGVYENHIDGRSITFTIPQMSGGSPCPSLVTMSSVTIVSSSYSTLLEESASILLGNNIAFLFCDAINLPFTGFTNNLSITHASNNTWNPTGFLNRPPAVPYSDLMANDINTDKRPFTNYAVYVPTTYPTNTNQGMNYDIPVGFAVLDKGFMVITHPALVSNFDWGINNVTSNWNGITGSTNQNNISYTVGANPVALVFNSVSVNFTTAVVCIALPGQFFFTNNPSWPLAQNVTALENGSNNFSPIYITQVGLYNINGEMIATAKLSEPVLKTYTNVITLNVNISV